MLLLLLLQGQASSKALDCDLLRKKLSAAETSISGLKIELSEREEELEDMKVTLQKTEAAAQVEQEKAAEQVGRQQRVGWAVQGGERHKGHGRELIGLAYLVVLECACFGSQARAGRSA